jgi:hypothetical protein
MSFTYDTTTQVGLVRLLIPDRGQPNALFSDEEINAMINMELSSHPKRAAALALETIASDRAMVLQVITTNGLSTNGEAVARALQKRADSLREQAMNEEAAQDGGAFDWAEMVTGNFSYRERSWSQIMKQDAGVP